MYKVSLSVEVEVEKDRIVDWYENICSGLGTDFHKELSEIVKKHIAKFPKIAKNAHKNARMLSLKRFPYNLIYTIDEAKKQVQIFAIVHDKRNPKIWKEKIKP